MRPLFAIRSAVAGRLRVSKAPRYRGRGRLGAGDRRGAGRRRRLSDDRQSRHGDDRLVEVSVPRARQAMLHGFVDGWRRHADAPFARWPRHSASGDGRACPQRNARHARADWGRRFARASSSPSLCASPSAGTKERRSTSRSRRRDEPASAFDCCSGCSSGSPPPALAALLSASQIDRTPTREPVAIGGPFTLTDSKGLPFSSVKLAGKPFAIFFGFTHCPDVCPTTLARLARLRRQLGRGDDSFAIVFVTVDPERDGPQEVGRYTALFGTPVIGLTGTPTADRPGQKAVRDIFGESRAAGRRL